MDASWVGGEERRYLVYRPSVFALPDLVAAPTNWLGHIPFAFWIVDALRPRVLVELGTHTGNSYSAFCQAVAALKLDARCYAVDTWVGDHQASYYGDEVYNTLAAFHDPRFGAFSRLLRQTFDEAVVHFSDGSIDLLHIDGLHTYEAVRHDFETWLPKLSERGVVLFHDVNVRHGDFGVWKLWEELSAVRPSFTFLHSHGLGVLATGSELPEPLRWLFGPAAADAATAQGVRGFFDRLGSGIFHLAETRRLEGVKVEQQAILDERLEEVRNLMTTVAKRDQDIAIIQTAIQEYEHREQECEHREQEYEVALNEYKRHEAALKGTLADRDRQLLALYTSTSWKVSMPVRRLGRLVGWLRRWYRNCLHRMVLVPLKDVTVNAGKVESVSSDPAFLLCSDRGRLPSGWCEIAFRVVATDIPLMPLLYVDTGGGFSEGDTVRLPPATATATGVISCVAYLPQGLVALRFDPTERRGCFRIEDFTIREIGKLRLLLRTILHYRGRMLVDVGSDLFRHGPAATKRRILSELLGDHARRDYESWIALYDTLSPADQEAITVDVAALPRRPLISVVMPVYNVPEEYLVRALDTVRAQLYPDWELCIADDASTKPYVAQVLKRYAALDSRIKVEWRQKNGHISAASNSALALATGEFVALMDHDDELPPHALYRVAVEINRHPDLDILYSDEDHIDEAGRRYNPYFKSDWDGDRLCGQNMVSHLGVYRRSLLEEIGGFREGYEGSQDYDLVLRAAERTRPERIRHVPMILYHWRVFSHSSSFSTRSLDIATTAARRAVADHFARCGIVAKVSPAPGAEDHSRVEFPVPSPQPLVSLIVPTRDKLELLRPCVNGLLHRTNWSEMEVLIVDNNSESPETIKYFKEIQLLESGRVRVLPYAGPFNYSAINNHAVRAARGSLIGLINNDIDVISPDWLTEMVSHAIRPEVGAVGAKLYYADNTIQHAGAVTGINGVANHIHKHQPRNHPGYFGSLRLVRNVTCVTAACLVMRRAVFDEVGGFDEERLKIAFNDVDLCLRLRKAGYLVVWTPHAELYHLESVSRGFDNTPDKIERFKGEVQAMSERWGEVLPHDPYYNPNLTLDDCNAGLAFPPRIEKPWQK